MSDYNPAISPEVSERVTGSGENRPRSETSELLGRDSVPDDPGPGDNAHSSPASEEVSGRKWPDDFRGWGSNVLPKRMKRSTR